MPQTQWTLVRIRPEDLYYKSLLIRPLSNKGIYASKKRISKKPINMLITVLNHHKVKQKYKRGETNNWRFSLDQTNLFPELSTTWSVVKETVTLLLWVTLTGVCHIKGRYSIHRGTAWQVSPAESSVTRCVSSELLLSVICVERVAAQPWTSHLHILVIIFWLNQLSQENLTYSAAVSLIHAVWIHC